MKDIYLQFSGDKITKSVNIILLHTLWDDIGSGAPLGPLRVNEFRNLVRGLAYEGYHFCSSEEMYQMYQGNWIPPSKSVYLTFDDGWRCADYYGTPILQEYGARATIFPECYTVATATGEIDGRLTVSQLSTMVETGVWDIGTHGWAGHGGPFPLPYSASDYTSNWYYRDRLTKISDGQLLTDEEQKDLYRADFQACKDLIEPITGKTVRSFVYPGGEYGLDGNDPEHIPGLLFSVLDEFDIIGYPVNGAGVNAQTIASYTYGEKHKGRRIAFNEHKSIMLPIYNGSDNHGVILSIIKTDDKYLRTEYNNVFRWHDTTNFLPIGNAFTIDMDVNPRLFCDEINNEFWGTGNFTLFKFNPLTQTVINNYSPAKGELRGCFIEGDYIYIVTAQTAQVWKSLKLDPTSWELIATLGSGSDRQWINNIFYLNNILYCYFSTSKCIEGYNIDTFSLVRRIHFPHNIWNANNIAGVYNPDNNINEWFFSIFGGYFIKCTT